MASNGGDDMADPATITAASKAAAAVLLDERTRKTIGWIIAAILSPLILIIVLVCALLSGTADHNNTAVDLCFHGGVIPGSMPADYREYIGDMRQSFTLIDGAIATVSADMEDSSSLDSVRVKAIFILCSSAQNLLPVGTPEICGLLCHLRGTNPHCRK